MSYARHGKCVPVETSQSAGAEAAGAGNETVAQQSITGYAFIDHRHPETFGRLPQATDKIARPIAVRIQRGLIAIRDRVAKCHYQALGRLSRNKYSAH